MGRRYLNKTKAEMIRNTLRIKKAQITFSPVLKKLIEKSVRRLVRKKIFVRKNILAVRPYTSFGI